MQTRRMTLNTCGMVMLTCILVSAPRLCGQDESRPVGSSQQGANDLQTAREYFEAGNLEAAERICQSLAGRGGPVAADAQALLERIKSWRACEQDAHRSLNLMEGGGCAQANAILLTIKQQCPGYPAATLDSEAMRLCPPPAPPPELDKGKTLFGERRYCQAKDYFESKLSANANSAELQNWIQKSKERCEVQRSEQSERNKKAAQDVLLLGAIREFYAGHFTRADELLKEYASEPSDRRALAYFYEGAIACTDYYLTGAKDRQKQTRAREFFIRASQADAHFTPPREWISPKIIEVYEKTVAER